MIKKLKNITILLISILLYSCNKNTENIQILNSISNYDINFQNHFSEYNQYCLHRLRTDSDFKNVLFDKSKYYKTTKIPNELSSFNQKLTQKYNITTNGIVYYFINKKSNDTTFYLVNKKSHIFSYSYKSNNCLIKNIYLKEYKLFFISDSDPLCGYTGGYFDKIVNINGSEYLSLNKSNASLHKIYANKMIEYRYNIDLMPQDKISTKKISIKLKRSNNFNVYEYPSQNNLSLLGW